MAVGKKNIWGWYGKKCAVFR